MFAQVLLRPVPHGAVGPFDEILTLLPLVIGVALLLYLYLSSRQAKPPPDGDRPIDDPTDL